MPRPAQPVVVIPDFPGIETNQDPRDFEPGTAEEQTNICSMVEGELRVRLGMIEITFEN